VITERRRWWPAGVALIAALLSLGIAMITTRYSERHPKPLNVLYVMDADAQKANWTARAGGTDAWLDQFLGTSPRRGGRRRSCRHGRRSTAYRIPQRDAPVADLPAPQATLLSAVPTEGGRNVTFRVTPGARATDCPSG